LARNLESQSPFKTPLGMRIHGSVARDLGIAIVAGEYPQGETLPGEIEFSERLRISRTAYREAVRILAAKGLVESRPKTGTRVLPRSRWNLLDPDVLAWTFATEPNAEFLRSLFELRMIVEPAAASLAASRRDGAQLARMGHALEEMASHGVNSNEGQAADRRFHDMLLEAAGNEMLLAMSSSVAAAIGWTSIFKVRRSKLVRDSLTEHRVLYDAIAAGSPTAARDAMVDLIHLALADAELSLEPVD